MHNHRQLCTVTMKLKKIALAPLLYGYFCVLVELKQLYSFLAPQLQVLLFVGLNSSTVKHFGEERERERAAIHNFQHIPIFGRQKKQTRSFQIHAEQTGARHLEKNPSIFFYNNKKIIDQKICHVHNLFFFWLESKSIIKSKLRTEIIIIIIILSQLICER